MQASSTTLEIIRKYLSMTREYNSPVLAKNILTNPYNWGGVSIQKHYPVKCDAGNINNRSIVTIVEYLGVKILIPGDNEACSWEELLGRPDFVEAIKNTHVLVAAHHGRESGFYSKLFEHFRPRLTVVSDGRAPDTNATNRYSAVSEGWLVHKKNGRSETRYCITTRNDGTIDVTVGSNANGRAYLDVRID